MALVSTNEMQDYYAVLNVSEDATTDEIKAAYRFHLKAFHPDRFTTGTDHALNAQKRTKEIIEAYGVLSKPHFRAEYDRFRRHTTHPATGHLSPEVIVPVPG